jgi:hypothetical protein
VCAQIAKLAYLRSSVDLPSAALTIFAATIFPNCALKGSIKDLAKQKRFVRAWYILCLVEHEAIPETMSYLRCYALPSVRAFSLFSGQVLHTAPL